jgi:hypothetical protein
VWNIVVDDAKNMDALLAFLRAVHVHVLDVSGLVLKVELPGAPSELHEQRELIGYVATWNALNPGGSAELVDP